MYDLRTYFLTLRLRNLCPITRYLLPKPCLICTVWVMLVMRTGLQTKKAFLRPPSDDGAVLQGRSQTLPPSLPVMGSIWRDKPVDEGLVIAIPVYSLCTSPKNMPVFLTVSTSLVGVYIIHLAASCFLLGE